MPVIDTQMLDISIPDTKKAFIAVYFDPSDGTSRTVDHDVEPDMQTAHDDAIGGEELITVLETEYELEAEDTEGADKPDQG